MDTPTVSSSAHGYASTAGLMALPAAPVAYHAAPPACEEVVLVHKTLTYSDTCTDVARTGRVVLPRLQVQQSLPTLLSLGRACQEVAAVRPDAPLRLSARLALEDEAGNQWCVVLKTWQNVVGGEHRPTFVLENTADMVKSMRLRRGDTLSFCASGNRLVVRPGLTAEALPPSPPARGARARAAGLKRKQSSPSCDNDSSESMQPRTQRALQACHADCLLSASASEACFSDASRRQAELSEGQAAQMLLCIQGAAAKPASPADTAARSQQTKEHLSGAFPSCFSPLARSHSVVRPAASRGAVQMYWSGLDMAPLSVRQRSLASNFCSSSTVFAPLAGMRMGSVNPSVNDAGLPSPAFLMAAAPAPTFGAHAAHAFQAPAFAAPAPGSPTLSACRQLAGLPEDGALDRAITWLAQVAAQRAQQRHAQLQQQRQLETLLRMEQQRQSTLQQLRVQQMQQYASATAHGYC